MDTLRGKTNSCDDAKVDYSEQNHYFSIEFHSQVILNYLTNEETNLYVLQILMYPTFRQRSHHFRRRLLADPHQRVYHPESRRIPGDETSWTHLAGRTRKSHPWHIFGIIRVSRWHFTAALNQSALFCHIDILKRFVPDIGKRQQNLRWIRVSSNFNPILEWYSDFLISPPSHYSKCISFCSENLRWTTEVIDRAVLYHSNLFCSSYFSEANFAVVGDMQNLRRIRVGVSPIRFRMAQSVFTLP